uniref:Uncharacterized protein n=1 Tax=Panagrolaimus sp. JU765 TaxID=591449 RepID=A0AC34PW25_9BILA
MLKFRFHQRSFFIFIAIIFLVYLVHSFYYQTNLEYDPEYLTPIVVTNTEDFAIPDNVVPLVPKIVVLNSDPRQVNQGAPKKDNPDASCKIPKLDKDNPEVLASYGQPKELPCGNYPENWLFIDKNGQIQATEYGRTVIGQEEIICKGQYFSRINDNKIQTIPIPEPVKVGFPVVDGDFLVLDCSAKEKRWKHLFMTVSPKKEVIERANTAKK